MRRTKEILIPINIVAAKLGLSTATIRRWERLGLLTWTPIRDGRNVRRYTYEQVEELEVIRQSKLSSSKSKRTLSSDVLLDEKEAVN